MTEAEKENITEQTAETDVESPVSRSRTRYALRRRTRLKPAAASAEGQEAAQGSADDAAPSEVALPEPDQPKTRKRRVRSAKASAADEAGSGEHLPESDSAAAESDAKPALTEDPLEAAPKVVRRRTVKSKADAAKSAEPSDKGVSAADAVSAEVPAEPLAADQESADSLEVQSVESARGEYKKTRRARVYRNLRGKYRTERRADKKPAAENFAQDEDDFVPDEGEVEQSVFAPQLFDSKVLARGRAAKKRELVSQSEKLHKVLADIGLGSRRDMEQLIVEGRISVNSEPGSSWTAHHARRHHPHERSCGQAHAGLGKAQDAPRSCLPQAGRRDREHG